MTHHRIAQLVPVVGEYFAVFACVDVTSRPPYWTDRILSLALVDEWCGPAERTRPGPNDEVDRVIEAVRFNGEYFDIGVGNQKLFLGFFWREELDRGEIRKELCSRAAELAEKWRAELQSTGKPAQ